MEQKSLDILKNAILIEKRGYAFYNKTADECQNNAVKEFFKYMADEEKIHVSELENQYKNFVQSGKFSKIAKSETKNNVDHLSVLTTKIKNEIAAASYEAAAISAAIALEQNAINFYKTREKETKNTEEKEIFNWLSNWETDHLDALIKIDKDLTQKIWFDNSFWPT